MTVIPHSESKLLFNSKEPNFNSITWGDTPVSAFSDSLPDSLQLGEYRVLCFGLGSQTVCNFGIVI